MKGTLGDCCGAGHRWLDAAASAVDAGAAGAAARGAFRLALLCGVAAWLSHRDALPRGTPAVLSQVGFQLCIPCLLFLSAARALAGGAAASLAAVPLVAAAQAAAGAALGAEAARAVEGRSPVARRLLGWREPPHPTPAAAAIAVSAAAALGVPAAVPALLPRDQIAPSGLPALIVLACAFGTSLAPASACLAAALPPSEAARAAAAAALFHATSSALLWAAGGAALAAGGGAGEAPDGAGRRHRPGGGFRRRFLAWRQRLVAALRDEPDSAPSDPSSAGQTGEPVVLTKQLPRSGGGAAAGAGASAAGGRGSSGSGGGQRPVFVAAEEVDEWETPAEALFRRVTRVARLLIGAPAAAAARAAARVVTPPVAGALLGAALGLSPAAAAAPDPAAAAAAAAAAAPPRVAWEVALLMGAARGGMELCELLAAAAPAALALAFATSLFSARPGGGGGRGGGGDADSAGEGGGGGGGGGDGGLEVERRGGVTTITLGGSPGGDLAQPGQGRGPFGGLLRIAGRGAESPDEASASVWQQLLPHGPWERRAAAAVAAVRLLLLPAASAALVLGGAAAGLLPRDGPLLLALLLQGCAPPGPALVALAHVAAGGGDRADGLAGPAARLVLQLFAAAVVPVALAASWAASAAAAAAAAGG
ncbi:hypothetical protein Rsub_02298 [Raphidocelis subcapitata]|uniref:Auxin efflux carrier n=1 Tax=Raphidocelis subcapitata TaxID=307507 RepID=A0A2V0NVI4_9CHLO|nr:hypothetical protein Rsub_02298 [Raphidocelis subcapitata]|eukprot:GBF89580.1 hypothetical protein Rsub_02298 [Raphidocelis subcapitata]